MPVDLCQGARLTASVVHAIRERATGRGRVKAQVSQCDWGHEGEAQHGVQGRTVGRVVGVTRGNPGRPAWTGLPPQQNE